MKITKQTKIAIVGGGPGGLTLATLLQQKGMSVSVYERDAHREVRVQGATLDLHDESGLAALRAAGLMDAFMANYRPGADKMIITDKSGTIKEDEYDSESDGTARPEIDRGPLRNILLDSLQEGTVVWDRQFDTMLPEGNGWQLYFKNGTTAYADILIAADGANSRLRPFVTPIQPFYAGVTVIEGSVYDSATAIPAIHKLLNGGKIFALGNSQSLIVSSKGDGSLQFYLGFNAGEAWSQGTTYDFTDIGQALAWFKEEFAGWGSLWDELFRNATVPFALRPQYCMPTDQYWEPLANITLLGDAAHLMPPYAGEGVNMAMLDALELSQCLTDSSFTDSKQAIADYETAMRKRAGEVAELTLQQTKVLHSERGLQYMLNFFGAE